MNRILLAEALGASPAASGFRELVTSAGRYGLVDGNYNSENIQLTQLGERFTQPADEAQRLESVRVAIRNVPIFDQLLEHFKNSKLPPTPILKGILEKVPFSTDPQWSQEVAELFIANGREAGFVRDVSGSAWVLLEAGRPVETVTPAIGSGESPVTTNGTGVTSAPRPSDGDEGRLPIVNIAEAPESTPRLAQFFIAFGKDREALKQFQTMLKELGIPYLVAEDEAHAGRPISEKVADLMKACSAGIFIFSADDKFEDRDGNIIFKPRENVVFELGAASLLYGRRIVIFKEKDVSFPTDFRDLGYIEYEKGSLAAKSIELLKELVALKAIRIQAGG